MIDRIVPLLVCLLPLIACQSSQLVDTTEVTVSKRWTNCTLRVGEDRTCEMCLAKGDDCFWCGGKVKKCLHYEWYFPDCELDDVKHKKCWVNWTALIVVCSVIAGIVLVILITVACCCICKCKECGRQRRKKAVERQIAKEEVKRNELTMKHMERSAKRDEEMQYYRDKYGIAKNDAGPLPEKRPLPPL